MNNYWTLYWITRLDYLGRLLVFLAVLSGIACLAFFIASWNTDAMRDYENRKEFINKHGKKMMSLFFICISFIVLRCFVPDRNELVFILVGGKTLNFAQSDSSLSKIPYQTTKIITDYLDRKLEEAKKEVNK